MRIKADYSIDKLVFLAMYLMLEAYIFQYQICIK
jgi:hypothetical protein